LTNTSEKYLLSIDVEDWFQTENLHHVITYESWNSQQLRIERNMDIILNILDKKSVTATFFILGWIADRLPDMIRRLSELGHEIASHGYGHQLVYSMTREEFRSDIKKTKSLLEDITGKKVYGYRAPSFSITDWAIEILAEEGYRYDSSLFPVLIHDRYGKLEKYVIDESPINLLISNFIEIKLSSMSFLGADYPWAGGGYFRMIPYPLFKRGIKNIIKSKNVYCFYIHPWEFDPDQPKIDNLKPLYRIRHYLNLNKTEKRFETLVTDFKFEPLRSILPVDVQNLDV
jgi:polysaccharide deacetylase family protein (PEP-CTERM system associated)